LRKIYDIKANFGNQRKVLLSLLLDCQEVAHKVQQKKLFENIQDTMTDYLLVVEELLKFDAVEYVPKSVLFRDK
jgi:hypothetical protein